MRIASWNVNSIKARLDNVGDWLQSANVDVLLLQELKGESFPEDIFKEWGYAHQIVVGQKAYNGVALLSKLPIADPIRALPGDDADAQARFVGGTVGGIRIYGLYLPNGNPKGTEKFSYKLAWMQRLHTYAANALAKNETVLFTGDFNVIPQSFDAKNPSRWVDDALYSPEARAAFQSLVNLGYIDAFRALHPEDHSYTFWDYTGGALQRNDGIRIDHFLLSPEAADRLNACTIDKKPRTMEKASDHTPIIVDIAAT